MFARDVLDTLFVDEHARRTCSHTDVQRCVNAELYRSLHIITHTYSVWRNSLTPCTLQRFNVAGNCA